MYRLFEPMGSRSKGTGAPARSATSSLVARTPRASTSRPARRSTSPRKGRPGSTTPPFPLAFAGIENQYFTVFLEPQGEPRISETVATVIEVKPDVVQKADISFEIFSHPISVGPNHPASRDLHDLRRPEDPGRADPYGAEGLVAYRKYQWFGIPGASTMARYVIAPCSTRSMPSPSRWPGSSAGRRGTTASRSSC